MGLRQTIASILVGDELRELDTEVGRLQKALTVTLNAYDQGPWALPPDQLVRQLKEVDPYLLQDLLWQLGWETIGGLTTAATDQERAYAVKQSVRLYRYSPLAQWAIWLWTSWGLGEGVKVVPNDENAVEGWTEFWTARRNAKVLGADRIHELSNWLLVKGNRFLTYYASIVDGKARVRLIQPEEITALVTNPEDSTEVWFYKREWTDSLGVSQVMYYPDWQVLLSGKADERWDTLVSASARGLGVVGAFSGLGLSLDASSKRADKVNESTLVCIQHLVHNIKDESALWGWPLLTTSRAWVDAHKQFTEARLSVAMAKAMFVRRKKVQSGSRGIESVMNTIASALRSDQFYDTNPPATPGSVELDNARIDTSDLPMTTGAGDAKADNEMFSWMALLGVGLFPTSAGLDTSRWATALEMDKAQSMLFAQFQTYWSGQFNDMVEIVLTLLERASGNGGGSSDNGNEGVHFEDKTAQVNIDTFSLADFSSVARVIGGLVGQTLLPAVAAQTVPAKVASKILSTLWRISLQALGVSNPEDLTKEEEWIQAPTPSAAPGTQAQAQVAAVPSQLGQPGQPGQIGTEEAAALERITETIERGGNGDSTRTRNWEDIAEWALQELKERFGISTPLSRP